MSKRRSINPLVYISIATGLIATTRHAAAIECQNTNHLTELCKLGVKHQIELIDERYGEEGYQAYIANKGFVEIESTTKKIVNEEGEELYLAPSRFVLNGTEAIKRVPAEKDVVLYITKGEPVYDTKGNFIGVWDPEIVEEIKNPNLSK